MHRMSRPDICSVVSIAARYASNPGHVHFKIVEKIIQYLNSTKNNEFSLIAKKRTPSIPNVTWIGWVTLMTENPPQE